MDRDIDGYHIQLLRYLSFDISIQMFDEEETQKKFKCSIAKAANGYCNENPEICPGFESATTEKPKPTEAQPSDTPGATDGQPEATSTVPEATSKPALFKAVATTPGSETGLIT